MDKEDLEKYKGTSIAELLTYHNKLDKNKRMPESVDKPDLLIGMCMDNRKQLRIPENFAYMIRTPGARLLPAEKFGASFAISVGGVSYIAIIGHTRCGMVNLSEKRTPFIEGMMKKVDWTEERAEKEFTDGLDKFAISNEIDFTLKEAKRVRTLYPSIMVVPLLYKVEDNKLYLIEEENGTNGPSQATQRASTPERGQNNSGGKS